MTELSREQIEILREHLGDTNPVNQLCDMALAKKDAEAECERLRERERRLYDALWTLDGHARLYMTLAENVDEQTTEALRNPPESEPCHVCGEKPEDLKWCDGPFCWCPPRPPEQTGPRWEPPSVLAEIWPDIEGEEPEQTEDALAALEALKSHARFGEYDDPDIHEANLNHWARTIRLALTASGVPEEVRRLSERMRENAAIRKDQAASIAQGDEEKRAYIRGQANAVKHWAEQVEAALASAPADDGFGRVDCAFAQEAFDSAQRADQDALNGKAPNHWDTVKAMGGCQRLLALIASAPTDGRE